MEELKSHRVVCNRKLQNDQFPTNSCKCILQPGKLSLITLKIVHLSNFVLALFVHEWNDDMRFTTFSAVFQSYQDDGRVIMKS